MTAQSVVPTRATATLAAAMIATARREGSGAEAVILHLDDLGPGQCAALVGLLLDAVRTSAPLLVADRKAVEERAFNEAEARAAHASWGRGDRSDWAIVGHRVYRRRIKRKSRAKAAERAQIEAPTAPTLRQCQCGRTFWPHDPRQKRCKASCQGAAEAADGAVVVEMGGAA